MGNNAASRQSTGKIFKTERLLINFETEVPAEANQKGEVIVKEKSRDVIAGYSVKYADDKAIWTALAEGKSVEDVDRTASVNDLYSQWKLSETERFTVYNPIMKYCPVKVTRKYDVITIIAWIKCVGDYKNTMTPIQDVLPTEKSPNYMRYGRPTGSKVIYDLIKDAFKFWEGNYKALKGVDSFDYDSEVSVTVTVKEYPVAPQHYTVILTHDRIPETVNSGEVTAATTLNSDGQKMNIYSTWSVAMNDFIIEAYTGYQGIADVPVDKQTIKVLYDLAFDDLNFKIAVAHEIGHLLGLTDAYDISNNQTGKNYSVDITPDEVPEDDLMRDGDAAKRKVTSNDIEMILNCWMKENRLQYFYDRVVNNQMFRQSKVIKISKSKISNI